MPHFTSTFTGSTLPSKQLYIPPSFLLFNIILDKVTITQDWATTMAPRTVLPTLPLAPFQSIPYLAARVMFSKQYFIMSPSSFLKFFSGFQLALKPKNFRGPLDGTVG